MPTKVYQISDLKEVPEEVLPNVLRQRCVDVPTLNNNIGTPDLAEESTISDKPTWEKCYDATMEKTLDEFKAFGHTYKEHVKERIANGETIPAEEQFESVLRTMKDKLQSAFVRVYEWVLSVIESGKRIARKLIDTTCQLIARWFTSLCGGLRHLIKSSA